MIRKATHKQAAQLFEIMVEATKVGSSPFYPHEVMAIWHKGRSAEGMEGAIEGGDVYVLEEDSVPVGFVHISPDEILGLFVHPEHHEKGYGRKLFEYAASVIRHRPIIVRSTLNAVGFYERLGCCKQNVESVRRHNHDIYVVRMTFT